MILYVEFVLNRLLVSVYEPELPSLVAAALRQGSKQWRRSKLSVVGEGRAGKTALTNAIVGKAFEETSSTVGIKPAM